MNKRKLVPFILGVILIGGLVLILRSQTPQPVDIGIVLRSNDSLGFARVLIAITNVSGSTQRVRCMAQIFEGCAWIPAFRQHSTFDLGRSLLPAEVTPLSIPMPDEGEAWRLLLICEREPALPGKLLRKLLAMAGLNSAPTPVAVTINMAQ